MAVFVFGIMLGNRESFGFKMQPGEAKKLEDYVATTAFIMRLFIFILLGAQVDFGLMKQYWLGGVVVVAIFMLVARPWLFFSVRCRTGAHGGASTKSCSCAGPAKPDVIPAALAGLLLGMKAPGAQMIASVTFIAILMTDSDPGADDKMAGRQARAPRGAIKINLPPTPVLAPKS